MIEDIDHDSKLMLQIKEGNKEAYSLLFRRNARGLFHFVSRFVNNPSVAEELVQDVFIKVYQAASKYEPQSRFKTYLYRIATNHCLNEVRKAHYKERFDSIEESKEEEAKGKTIEIIDSNPIASTQLEGKDMASKLQTYLDELPEKQRMALLLNRLEGLSYQEIAELMEMSVGAVKSLLHRAKSTLQHQLEKWNDESEVI